MSTETFDDVLADVPSGRDLEEHLSNAECCENINDLAVNIECALEEAKTLQEQLQDLLKRALKLKKEGKK